jgi:hypothetical protein
MISELSEIRKVVTKEFMHGRSDYNYNRKLARVVREIAEQKDHPLKPGLVEAGKIILSSTNPQYKNFHLYGSPSPSVKACIKEISKIR